jgi:hypothetical protein
MGRPRKPASVLMLLLLAGSADAAERKLSGTEIREHLIGHMFRHADNTKMVMQTFRAEGITYYYEGSAQSEGRWDIRGDKYCAQWPPRKGWTCYAVSGGEAELTFISAAGARYPIKRLD